MRPTTVVPFTGRLFLIVSVVALVACGGNAAGPEPPNPPGVADTIVLDLLTADIEIGDTARLGFVARDVNGAVVPNVTLTWRSLNPSVATVSADGLITTRSFGETQIEVEAIIPGVSPALLIDSSLVGSSSLRNPRSRANVYVIPKVSISPTTASAVVHDHTLFTVSVTDLNGQPLSTRPVIKWATFSPSVATIDVTGLTTALSKGTTKVMATVSVGSARGVTREATLNVSDGCGGIAEVQTLTATLSYKYAAAGTLSNLGRVGSVYSGDVTATMTNLGWEPGIPTVVWKGTLAGSATQLETVFDSKNKEVRRLEGAGPVVNVEATGAHSDMTVIVDLADCSYRWETQVSINLDNYADGIKIATTSTQSARLYAGEGKKLSSTGGSPFPIATDQEFGGHSPLWPFEHPKDDVFAPQGWAASLIQQTPNQTLGSADVNYVIATKSMYAIRGRFSHGRP